MQLHLLFVVVVVSVCFMEAAASAARKLSVSTPHYELWRYGAKTNVKVSHLPGAVLIGGGPDCQAAFEHFILNANGGDMVVMRASGDDAYNDWIFGLSLDNPALKPLNSITTIKWNGRQASFDADVINVIRNAAAVFFAGGDQSMYLDFWSQTPIQSILQDKLLDTTMGGTSAGLAIMGNYIYPAYAGSAQSVEALQNPYNPEVELASFFLKIPYMGTIFTDTHFCTRDRMGRLLTFLSRELQDQFALPGAIHGVGIDEQTALLLDVTTGAVRAVGSSYAFVCTPPGMPKTCLPGQPLTATGINCMRLNGTAGDTFSFKTFSGSGVTYINSVANGEFTEPYPDRYGPGLPPQPFVHTDDA